MEKKVKIYVAGHNGMAGSALVSKLKNEGYDNLVLKTSAELDLRNQNQVNNFFNIEKPEYVFLAAAKVGGIHANSLYRAEFVYDNLMIEANVINASYLSQVKKLLYLGSSCIYPKMAPQPLKEDYLLSGYLEKTNQSYAIAKIAGIEMCEAYRFQYGCNYISVMPTNLYGPNDNYDLNNSHVLAALMRKFITAKINNEPYVTIWGTGVPRREFMHVHDLADACLFLMKKYDSSGIINIGIGEDISISKLAEMIKSVTKFNGGIRYDSKMPNGTPQKLMDITKIQNLGWRHRIELSEGLEMLHNELLTNPKW